jgi:hypothetical protein
MSGESVEHICVKHLRYDLRVLVCFAGDEIWVLLVGPHSRSASENTYDLIAAATGSEGDPPTRRLKPPCCEETGDPPELQQESVESIIEGLQHLSRRARQRRR